jgi:hypothetical protein
MKYVVPALFLLMVSCASGPVPVAERSADATAIDQRWSILVVTADEDGEERVTRIWIAVLGGEPVLRTGNSRWWQNLERDPSLRVRMAGQDSEFQVEFVTEESDRARIDEVFLDKYGGWERVLFPQERGKTHTNYARLRPG